MNITKKELILESIGTIFSCVLAITFSLLNHFYFLNSPERDVNEGNNWVLLIFICLFALCYLLFYFINIFKLKNLKVFILMNSVSYGICIFSFFAISILSLILENKLVFDKDYISLLITSSFTLLGFGLTICAIIVNFLIRRLKFAKPKQRVETIFVVLLPYSLLFIGGLVYTISTLIDLQYIETNFYKIIVYKSLFYSASQMAYLLFCIIGSLIYSVIIPSFTKYFNQ